MKQLLIVLLSVVSLLVSAQDSITVLQYNLLNYGNYTDYCHSSNNNHLTKEGYLRTIISYTKPDIFTVNELGKLNYYHERLLTEVMNTEGRSYYKRVPATNIAGSDLINMLFYDSTRLALRSMQVIQSYIRDVNLYTLYYRTPDLLKGDTIFINCVVAHLKAGNSSSDAYTRGVMASNIIEWLQENRAAGNYLLMGDFNLYTAGEDAYQYFTTSSAGTFQFMDPINSPGDWNNNVSFAPCHTQSVTSTSNGCQAGGGMDDRFDFILATDAIMEGSDKVKYKDGSYKAIGQDGKHFNQSITNLPNNSVPYDVLSAIGKNSDHLPVTLTLELAVEEPGAIAERNAFKGSWLSLTSSSEARLHITSPTNSTIQINLYSSTGQLLATQSAVVRQGFNHIDIAIGSLHSGFYLVNMRDKSGNTATLKLIKQR